MDVDYLDCQGTFSVLCDPALYGAGETVLRYRVWQEEGSRGDPKEALDFVREHYRQGYGQVLAGVCAAYRRSPLWDVWMGDDERPARLEFTAKEELHPYMGTPDVELAFYGDSFLWGLTFGGKGNRLSIEHGLCAVFEGDILTALVDSADFPEILRWWKEYKANNILTDLPSV